MEQAGQNADLKREKKKRCLTQRGAVSGKKAFGKKRFVAGNGFDVLGRLVAVYDVSAAVRTYAHVLGPGAVTYDCKV